MQPQSVQLMDDAASPASSAISLLLGLPGACDPPSWVCLSFFACPGHRQTGGNGGVSESTFKAELDSCHGELSPLLKPAVGLGLQWHL